ncbi:MAG TPA: hypothetical protein VNS09_11645 [Solirubrobacter sp.]|nr:hypothetical protein [Solirubrobacter sp.]
MITEAQRLALAPYCDGCGRPAAVVAHAHCGGATDTPRYCARCGRKLAVQILPTGYTARCVRCP